MAAAWRRFLRFLGKFASVTFSPPTDAIMCYLTPELEIIRMGLSRSWRRACGW